MTASAETAGSVRDDLRTVLSSGAKLGVMAAVGVVTFALLSKSMSGFVETVLEALIVLAGGILFSFAPALWVRPNDVDSIAWASLVGLLGALAFTVLDIALLRPLGIYHWTWDEIGGGSGFWYIPVWWMASTSLAWVGAWIYGRAARSHRDFTLRTIGLTVVIALVCFVGIATLGAGFSAAIMALAFAVALVVHLGAASLLHRS